MKAKVIMVMILIIFLTIFISQNSMELPVNVLFWELQIPGIILILMTGLLGIIIGFFLALIFKKPINKNTAENEKSVVSKSK